MKACIIGLGQIGYPVAEYFSAKGFDVWGYDISPATVEHAQELGKFKATTSWSEIPEADVYVVCVTTGQLNNCPDVSAVFDVCRNISKIASASAIVSVESTIVPGTSQKIFIEIFKGKIKLIHVPHRYWSDEPEKHGVDQIRVIGAVNDESLKAGIELYQETLRIPLHICKTIEVAEMCKIIENSHRYLQIAFAEDLRMLCDNIGMDFEGLRAAMNTKWNVDLPEVRDGIGRHCLPKDIRYVMSLSPSVLLDAAIKVDAHYRDWLTKQKS